MDLNKEKKLSRGGKWILEAHGSTRSGFRCTRAKSALRKLSFSVFSCGLTDPPLSRWPRGLANAVTTQDGEARGEYYRCQYLRVVCCCPAWVSSLSMGIVREEWNETLAVRACLGDWLLVSRGWRKGTRGKQGGWMNGWRERWRMDLSGSLSQSIHPTVVSLTREIPLDDNKNWQRQVCGFISTAASPTSGPQIDPAAQTWHKVFVFFLKRFLSPWPKHPTAFFSWRVKWPSVLRVTTARSVAFYISTWNWYCKNIAESGWRTSLVCSEDDITLL